MSNRIRKGEGWIGKWSEGLKVPILKKGEGRMVSDYREVTLAPTMYKIYATMLAERLREEVEGKGLIPSSGEFRKRMGTMDNVYMLNYLINRQIVKRSGKLVLLFVDLKAAFDSVDRQKLLVAMRKRR